MTQTIVVAGLLLIFGTTAGVAERNLIPTLDNHPNVCPDQPPEPKWMQNINVRESYKRLLIQQIYRAQSMERVVDSQNCDCPIRYPTWEDAVRFYTERYASSECWDVVEATSEYRRQANELRRAAMPICVAAGNW